MLGKTVNSPEKFWERIAEMAEDLGLTQTEVARQCLELGIVEKEKQLAATEAYRNARMVGQKLRLRLGKMEKAIADLAEIVGDDAAAASKLQELKGYLKD